MKATQANIVVDLKQTLSPQSGADLVNELIGELGVSRAWVSPRTSRLVLVDFDPMQTDTQHILHTVVARGFDARLVGM